MVGSANFAPPFHAEHIGSLLRPDEQRRAFRELSKGEITADQFRAVQDQCIRDVVGMQEDIGLQVVTDGEFRRTTYISHFVESVEGLEFAPSSFRFYDTVGGEHDFVGPQCVGKIKRVKSNSGEEFDFLKTLTDRTPKMTLPSPATMHFLGGANPPPAEAYADVDEFFSDLAAAYEEDIADLAARGARYVQIDDVPFPMLCDPALRGQLEQRGIDPENLLDQYIELTSAAVRNRPEGVTAALHLCRGNLKGTWLSQGGYEAVARKLFQQLEVDAFFLEYDTERAGGFKPLAEMPDDKFVVLGLISSKLSEMEDTDAVKARIDAASKFIPLDRLGLSPQCGFSSAVAGNPVTIDDQKAKLQMVVDIAADVWG